MDRETSAHLASRALRANEIGCLLISDGSGHLVGIVTDRDFACRLAADHLSTDVPIHRIMTPDPVQADENDNLGSVIALMETHGVRRIPIVRRTSEGQQRAIGIVTLDDLIASGTIAPSHLSQIVRRQIGRRLSLSPEFPKTARSSLRSEAHQHQTLDRFYAFLSQATGLTPDTTPQVAQFILGSLLMRVTASAASHFVAQLPKLIQPSLLSLPPGPDRRLTSRWIVSELVSRYRFTEEFSRTVLRQFLAALQRLMDPGQIRHLKSQLSEDFQELFPTEERKYEEWGTFPERGMTLKSPSFRDGEEIPVQYTGNGSDRSPPLEWSRVPTDTKEFVLICESPDANYETAWVHWVVYGLSPTITFLPEGIGKSPEISAPVRAWQGKNSWGNLGYQGPMPSAAQGTLQYVFRLYALDKEIVLPAGVTRAQLALEMQGHILAEAELFAHARSAVRRPA